ncbi:MAG TPA: putative Ig domain-containing protein [Mycobacteriales bacterium]|nr:putative Ig domain-containing protein [Mycobacteriales bacterium]
MAARTRLIAVASATAALIAIGSPPAHADDPDLTLTARSGGTAIFGGVGTPLRDAAPYTVSGGSGHVTWGYQGLPQGLNAAVLTGVITGTPTLSGSYPLTITVSDGDGQTQTADTTLLIDPIGMSTVSGQPSYVIAIAKDAVSTEPVVASGDTEDLTWSATGLPPGLTIDQGSGTVSGHPTQVGGYTTRFKATNTVGNSAYLSVLFEVVTGYTCNYQQSGTVGESLSINCGVFWSPKPNTGGRWLRMPGRLRFTASGLPGGLQINSNSGMITGTPTKRGTRTFTVTVSAHPDGILVTRAVTWKSSVRCVIGN